MGDAPSLHLPCAALHLPRRATEHPDIEGHGPQEAAQWARNSKSCPRAAGRVPLRWVLSLAPPRFSLIISRSAAWPA
eukprot:6527172-Pyramimonas_sp.AAC.1